MDENPGDRASLCGGAMSSESVVVSSGTERIIHRCTRCGFIRPQDVAKEDNREAVIALSAQPFTQHLAGNALHSDNDQVFPDQH